jgi:hypothetical protein
MEERSKEIFLQLMALAMRRLFVAREFSETAIALDLVTGAELFSNFCHTL